MTALEDRRPVAAETARSEAPDTIGDMLAKLLADNPEIELTTIRLIPNEDGTVGIAGRVGALAGVECPQCHQPAGRGHTEYCPLALAADPWHAPLDGPPMHAWTDDNGTPRAHPVSTCSPTLCGLEPW